MSIRSNPSDDCGSGYPRRKRCKTQRGQELIDALNGLNEQERIELLALAWLGRGDHNKGGVARGAERGPPHPRRQGNRLPDRYAAASPTYLEKGLSLLGILNQDYEIGRL